MTRDPQYTGGLFLVTWGYSAFGLCCDSAFHGIMVVACLLSSDRWVCKDVWILDGIKDAFYSYLDCISMTRVDMGLKVD